MISAMLEEGSFDPARFRVGEEDLSCLQQVWSWCSDHQDRVGRAPSVELVSRHFPEFTVTPDVDPYWAAHRLRQASAGRQIRSTFQDVMLLLNDDDVEGAYALMDNLNPPIGMRRDAVRLFDVVPTEEEFVGTRVDVPFLPLATVSGGIRGGEVWALSARTGQGKTNIAAGAYVPYAINNGFNVAYFSCEMPAEEIAHMVRCGMARSPDLSAMLCSLQQEHREHAIELLRAKTHRNGGLSAYDPSHGRITVESVRDALVTHDLVVVDHIELMSTTDGRLAIEDWRVLAEISIRLREETLRHRGRLIVLSQANRDADSNNPLRTPKLTEMSGSDQIPRDASVVVTMSRFSTSVMLHDAVKVRKGPSIRFFTTYDPVTPEYRVISRVEANRIAAADANREAAAVGF